MYGILHSRATLTSLKASVQKYALRVCTKSWELSYNDLLNATSIPPLHKRPAQLLNCLSHLYKILNGLTEFQMLLFEPKNFSYKSRSADSTYLCVPNFSTSSHQHSFFPKTITAWNNLPTDVCNCNSFKSFKSNVTKYLN